MPFPQFTKDGACHDRELCRRVKILSAAFGQEGITTPEESAIYALANSVTTRDWPGIIRGLGAPEMRDRIDAAAKLRQVRQTGNTIVTSQRNLGKDSARPTATVRRRVRELYRLSPPDPVGHVSLTARLVKHSAAQAEKQIRRHYRVDTITINIGAQLLDVRVREEKYWRKRDKWPRFERHLTIDWPTTDYRSVPPHARTVQGHVVLWIGEPAATCDLAPLAPPRTWTDCYRASWLIQGRGYKIGTARGWVGFDRAAGHYRVKEDS